MIKPRAEPPVPSSSPTTRTPSAGHGISWLALARRIRPVIAAHRSLEGLPSGRARCADASHRRKHRRGHTRRKATESQDSVMLPSRFVTRPLPMFPGRICAGVGFPPRNHEVSASRVVVTDLDIVHAFAASIPHKGSYVVTGLEVRLQRDLDPIPRTRRIVGRWHRSPPWSAR